jgi:Protein of unknown function (DUF4038)/Putative collagen-binding domain of a collagenase
VEAEYYLETRRVQGFNVIQAVVLAEFDGIHTPNANGHVPLLGDDPTRLNPFYFRYVDEIIRLAASKGLYIGLLPTWGDKVHASLWGTGPVIFTTENAQIYGRLLGQRYRNDLNILWVLGGDRPAEGYETLWAAMAAGIEEGLGYRPFFTYHPNGGQSSSAWLHDADWLDMHMMQSGHVLVDAPNWQMIQADYERIPAKPVIDGEPCYEDHPIDPFLRLWRAEYGRYNAYDVRKLAYRAVFAGACGHTYGNHSIWQFWALQRAPINFPMPPWDEAILRDGAAQLIHLKNLMLSLDYFDRIPAQDLLLDLPVVPPADAAEHTNAIRAAYPVATRSSTGSYALIFFPLAGQRLQLDLRVLAGAGTAQWYDPRTGVYHPAGSYAPQICSFTSPLGGPDWVLVLKAATQ